MFGSRTREGVPGRRLAGPSTLACGTLPLQINFRVLGFRVLGLVPRRPEEVTGTGAAESRPATTKSLDFMFSLWRSGWYRWLQPSHSTTRRRRPFGLTFRASP
jgi:hypothetical protein